MRRSRLAFAECPHHAYAAQQCLPQAGWRPCWRGPLKGERGEGITVYNTAPGNVFEEA
jgi:hypothetical protein